VTRLLSYQDDEQPDRRSQLSIVGTLHPLVVRAKIRTTTSL
jgi:hypothetical protein